MEANAFYSVVMYASYKLVAQDARLSGRSIMYRNMNNIHTAHLIDSRRTKGDNTCCTEEGTTLTSLRNIIKTPISVAQKAQQFAPNFGAPDDGRIGVNM
jgi:methyl coenzyme M reductase alpha subunit